MNAYDMYGADKQKEVDGITLDFGEFKIKIARAGGANLNFAKVMEEISRPYRRAMAQNVLDPKIGERILAEGYAKAIVKKWEGVKDADGNDLPFSVDNCIKLFTDLPDLFAAVREEAEKLANFKKAAKEDEAKNS